MCVTSHPLQVWSWIVTSSIPLPFKLSHDPFRCKCFVYTCGSSYINILNMAWFHVLSPFLSGITLPACRHTSCLLSHFLPVITLNACCHTFCLPSHFLHAVTLPACCTSPFLPAITLLAWYVYVHPHAIYHSVIMVSERQSSSLYVRSWVQLVTLPELFIRDEY